MIDDALFIVGGGFALAAAMLIVVLATGFVGEAAAELPLSAADNATMQGVFSRLPGAFDSAVGIAIIGLMAASLVLMYYLAVSPALFFVIVMVMSLLTILAGALSNAWATLTTDSALSAVVTTMPKTDFILQHYVAFVVMYLVLACIVFFAKPQEGAVA